VEQLLGGIYDGLRLATMLVCLGAANALASPKRLLRAVPGALHELGTAVVVAVSVAPQLVESALRVRRARRLRGGNQRGPRVLRSIAVPVLVDAMDRSLRLAAAMDSRGYGRRTTSSHHWSRTVAGAALLTGLLGICVGMYAVLDGTAPRALGLPVLAGGAVAAMVGLYLGGRRVQRSVYRPDRWRTPEVLVALCGVATAADLYASASTDPANLYPSLSPVAWPTLPIAATIGILVALLPAWLTPPPPVGTGGVPTTPRTEPARSRAEEAIP
jgi:energy-coupling factor transport system permease protein